jgi:serine/threonine-protein kinase 24/25/MST4
MKIHRDLKCANILLNSNGDVKIADFGVSAQISDSVQKRSSIIGTPCWMAPEILIQNNYDFKCDIWSIGISVIEMATGTVPYSNLSPMCALLQIHQNDPPQLEEDYFSKDLKDFVKCCLVKDPSKRPTTVDLIRHRFIQNAK